MHFRIVALELDRNRCLSQIGTHREICDRGDQSDGSCDIVENAMWTSSGEGHTDYGECWDEHNSTDGLRWCLRVRDAIQAFEAGKQRRCQRTKYQLEPWLVMAISETAPLTTWLPLTGMALLTMMESVWSSSYFVAEIYFVEDCIKIETGDMCEAEKIGKKGVGRARNVMSVCIIFQRACRMMTTSVIWGFFPIALFSAFSRWRQVSIIWQRWQGDRVQKKKN